jgi:hypothetical protein
MDTLTTRHPQPAPLDTPLTPAKRKRLVGKWIEVDGKLIWRWTTVES